MSPTPDPRPLVLHVVYWFATGGLENGVVNLINQMPRTAYRHAVMALTEVTDFKQRVQPEDVQFFELHKPPGHALKLYPRLYRLMRELRPAIVHTRNLAALEVAAPAWLARVPVRVHGEHGRDVEDLDGSNRHYQRLRRLYQPFVTHYVALSRDLQSYLEHRVGTPAERITQIYNGVDTARFAPSSGAVPAPIAGCPFDPQRHWLAGTVGRLQKVKDQPALARAFVRALELAPELRARLRLAIVGEGALRADVEQVLAAGGASDLAWLPGERGDVPDVMRGMNCFVLPSLAEGISNTILEAMSTALPVIATDVGGNAELVTHERTGLIVPAADVETMAAALVQLARQPQQAATMGREGRAEVERRFSMQAMVAAYQGLYDRLLKHSGAKAGPT